MPRFIAILILGFSGLAMAGADGLQTRPSSHDVKTTIDRLESALRGKGMTIFARVDHAAGAARVGQSLRPTELLIFGNPNVGTKLMQCVQTAGIDLPLKALAWEDAAGKVWLSYTHPAFMSARHGLEQCAPVIEKVTGALRNFAAAATMP